MRERGEARCLLRLREVLRGEDSSRTVPLALEHLGEVSSGDDVLGEMVEQSIKDLISIDSRICHITELDLDSPVRNRLVDKLAESLLSFGTVLELGKEQGSPASEERTGSVTVIDGITNFARLHQSNKVVGEDRGLASDSGGSFGSGERGTVTEREDILVLLVLESTLVDVNPSDRIGKRGFFDSLERAHRGDGMQETKFLLNLLTLLFTSEDLEDSSLALGTDLDEVSVKQGVDTLLLSESVESLGVVGNGEHGGHTGDKGRVVFLVLGFPPVVGHVVDFLGSTGTLDHTEGLGEDGFALTLEVTDKVPSFVGGLVRVDGRDLALGGVGKSSRETLNVVPVCTTS